MMVPISVVLGHPSAIFGCCLWDIVSVGVAKSLQSECWIFAQLSGEMMAHSTLSLLRGGHKPASPHQHGSGQKRRRAHCSRTVWSREVTQSSWQAALTRSSVDENYLQIQIALFRNDFPSGEQSEQRWLSHKNQLPVVEQYFTNIAAIQNMGVL